MNLFTKYLSALAEKEHKHFYVQAMTGHLPKNLQNTQTELTDESFTRKCNCFAHWAVRFYKEDENGFKDYDKMKYYYVVYQKKSIESEIKIRADLNEIWMQSGRKDVFVLLLNETFGQEVCINQFIPNKNTNYKDASYVTSCMNTDMNWVHVYLTGKRLNQIYLDEVKVDTKLNQYITESEKYIEPVLYAKYKNMPNSRTVKVINSKTNKETQFKSLKQCYDLMQLQKLMSYKKFQRVTRSGINTITVGQTDYVFLTVTTNIITA